MNTSLHAHLTFLYGPEQAAAVAPRLEALLARFQQESPGEAASQKRDLTDRKSVV